MKITARAAISVLALASLALAGAGAVRGAGPELGGRISAQHLPIVWEQDRHAFEVRNESTIGVRVHLEVSSDHPAGWLLDTESFTLAVNEARTVTITGAGEAPAVISATLTGLGISGTDANVLRLELAARHASWIERMMTISLPALVPAAFLLALVALLAVIVAWRRRRGQR